MKRETVHLIATIFWGTFGISVGVIAAVNNDLNIYTMVTLVSAIVGNSVHLISMSLSKTGFTEISTQAGVS